MTEGRKPAAFDLAEPAPDKALKSRKAAPSRKPRFVDVPPAEAENIVFTQEAEIGSALVAVRHAPLTRKRHGLGLGFWFTGAVAGLVSLWAGLGVVRLVDEFFLRAPAFGWIALALGLLAGAIAIFVILREIWGLVRLRHIAHIQTAATEALAFHNETAATRALASLGDLFKNRDDVLPGVQHFATHRDDIMTPVERVQLFDRAIVEPLDGEVHRIIARTARRVTLLTALLPTAALDILVVAAQNLRMIRDIAALYGGRPSGLATVRLARAVLGHLALTGGLALSDSLIQNLLGKGLVGRISARFGEGAVNGILTARIGLAACEVCRPIPRQGRTRDSLGALVREALDFSGPDVGAADKNA